jgi:hypothetical protein
MSGKEDILQAVKDNFKLFGGGEEEVTDVQVEHFINCVRSSKQKILLQQPRRGEWTLRHPNDVYICFAAVFVLSMQLMVLHHCQRVCALPCLSPNVLHAGYSWTSNTGGHCLLNHPRPDVTHLLCFCTALDLSSANYLQLP